MFLYAPHSNAAVQFDIVCKDSQTELLAGSPAALSSIGDDNVMFVDTGI